MASCLSRTSYVQLSISTIRRSSSASFCADNVTSLSRSPRQCPICSSCLPQSCGQRRQESSRIIFGIRGSESWSKFREGLKVSIRPKSFGRSEGLMLKNFMCLTISCEDSRRGRPPRDDIKSLALVVLFLLRGNLPTEIYGEKAENSDLHSKEPYVSTILEWIILDDHWKRVWKYRSQ
jgi:hypothetical protein